MSTVSTAAESAAPTYARSTPRGTPRWVVIVIALAIIIPGAFYLPQLWSLVMSPFGPRVAAQSMFTVQPMDLVITLLEDGELKPQESLELRNEVEGQSTILFLAAESSRVKKGDLLVELSSDELKERLETEMIQLSSTRTAFEAAVQDLEITRSENASKLKKAQIDLRVAELDLDQYVYGDFEQKQKTAELDLEQALEEIKRKEEDLRKNQELLTKEYVTQSKIDDLEFELEKARTTAEKARLAKKTLEEFEHPKTLAQKQSTRDQAKEELEREQQRAASREAQAAAKVEEQKANLAMREKRTERLQEQLSKTRIVAPIDGIVQYPSSDGGWRGSSEMLGVGIRVFEGQSLVVLPNTSQMKVEMRIHEGDRHQVKEDMRVEVRVPAVPGEAFSGKITKIAKFADSANRWLNPNLKEHTTEVILDDTSAPVSPGDSAEVNILVDRLSSVLAIPVQCVFARGQKSYVFVRNGVTTRVAEVELGASNRQLIEIKGGLTAGDRVLMHADEQLLAMLPTAAEPEAPVAPPPAVQPPQNPARAAGSKGPPGRPTGTRGEAVQAAAVPIAAGSAAGAASASPAPAQDAAPKSAEPAAPKDTASKGG